MVKYLYTYTKPIYCNYLSIIYKLFVARDSIYMEPRHFIIFIWIGYIIYYNSNNNNNTDICCIEFYGHFILLHSNKDEEDYIEKKSSFYGTHIIKCERHRAMRSWTMLIEGCRVHIWFCSFCSMETYFIL